MSLIDTGWQMIGISLFSGMMGFWGSSTLFLTIPIAKWFVSKRGRAMSVFPAIPFGIGISSPLTQMLIDAVGWRDAWFILGIAGGLSIAAVSLAFVATSRRPRPAPRRRVHHARRRRAREAVAHRGYSWTVRSPCAPARSGASAWPTGSSWR